MSNRNSQKILGSLLECTTSKVGISQIISKTNTNHTRIKVLLGKLLEKDLVVKFDKEYVITEKGRDYLESYKRFHRLAESFGLEL